MHKLKTSLRQLLLQGTRPEDLSLTLSLGLLIGTLPVLGVTTVLCAGAAVAFRLNMPLIMIANYLAYPVQLFIYIPLLLLGASMLDPTLSRLSLESVYEMLRADLWGAVLRLFWANLGAVLIWGAAAVPLGFFLYSTIHRLVRNFHQTLEPSQ